MIVDTSALIAILRDEPDAPACARAIENSAVRRVPPDGSAPRIAATTAQQGITDDQNSNRHWIKIGGNVR